ncbi:MAG TPA: tetrahydrofolate dehydrogenase/cyclohydrolase catalytic domain-containing protein [Bacteroidales bacterium]|nr:tetrahydrofolate dehydrogenase/cyclohydrolase catalytic domain-containing protein [Bacteroidales bacterium]HPT02111.1 tetrahydrofolate dehydrogenase/cyclohydrolase catalytic domain-containing protein [Bacteroidales bacterium]
MQIIDGKKLAIEIKQELARQTAKIIDSGRRAPHLAAILVGDDPASDSYVKGKEKACREIGFTSSVYRLAADTTVQKLMEIVDFLNNDDDVDGFIVQLPMPGHIPVDKVISRIKPEKDVDGFHPVNIGRMVLGSPAFISATPLGIITMLDRYGIETEGKHCVVLGRSNIVGTPISILLSRKAKPGNCTVTLCHTKTVNIKEIAATADILISAIGKPEYVTADMVKEGAVVIDVGIHRIPDPAKEKGYHMTGDVKYDEVAPKCSYITPVPGGVGLMTVVSLLMNTMKAYNKEI